ncbi:imidazole glycerol phosphate synthase subunit HisH [Clostridium massiliamazoniense]|uniref:imidazole glycerol phosphate synthase subunit HisH n=1 Tax=Clostridium massiliamazoniense TaxID=1347366 RepID=UPI0006D83AA4|nr:imidazole glycerol phosphate synthase subunit HisH [Clostridium massiliamazoniense]
MITIIDYGMGNLKSVYNALRYLNIECEITNSKEKIEGAKKIILPGVGAFKDAIENLKVRDLDKLIIKKAEEGIPILGICLGMQLLFDKSYEGGEYEGLSLIKGEIRKLDNSALEEEKIKIPHIGWNNLRIKKVSPILKDINENDFVYFVHSYYGVVKSKEDLIGDTIYGNNKIAAVVGNNNVFGTQFHPEKSGEVGLKILKNFGEMI